MKNLKNWIALLRQIEGRALAVRSSMEKELRDAEAVKVLKSLGSEGEIKGDVLSVFADINIEGLKEAIDELKESGGVE